MAEIVGANSASREILLQDHNNAMQMFDCVQSLTENSRYRSGLLQLL